MRTLSPQRTGDGGSRLWQGLRDGGWITRRRIRTYALLLIGASLAAGAWFLSGRGIRDPAGRPVGTDFLSFWSVSAALWRGRLALVYDPPALAAWERSLAGSAPLDGYYAWFYPPLALLLVAPLALLPYLWSLALWLGLGLAAYLATLWRILKSRLGLVAALGFPAVFVTLSHGQNAFLTTALLGSALLLLPRRPAAAGVLAGALAFKPQLALLLPVALLAGRHWRALMAAAATVLGLSLLTLLLFGPVPWQGFLASTRFSRATLELGLVPFSKQQSVFAAARLLGGSIAAAYLAQALASAGAAAGIVWAWRQPVAQDLKNAALVVAGLVAAPFLLDYDLLLLALPIAWMVPYARARGLDFERTGLALASALPLFARPVAELAHLPLTPLVLTALLALALRRIAAERPAGAA